MSREAIRYVLVLGVVAMILASTFGFRDVALTILAGFYIFAIVVL